MDKKLAVARSNNCMPSPIRASVYPLGSENAAVAEMAAMAAQKSKEVRRLRPEGEPEAGEKAARFWPTCMISLTENGCGQTPPKRYQGPRTNESIDLRATVYRPILCVNPIRN